MNVPLVIKNDLQSQLDFKLFFNLFHFDVWICSLGLTILVILVTSLLEVSLLKIGFKSGKFSNRFFESLALTFNGSTFGDSWTKFYRPVIFVISLHGIFIWMHYNGNLTSFLTEIDLKLPFQDLQGLLQTNYFLTTSPKHGSSASKFLKGNS